MIKLKARLEEDNWLKLDFKYKNTSPFEYYCVIVGLIQKAVEDNEIAYKDVFKLLESNFKEEKKNGKRNSKNKSE